MGWVHCTGWPKSYAPTRKLNIFLTTRAKELIFLPVTEVCISFICIKTFLGRPFVKYYYWPQQEKFTFSQFEKKSLCRKKLNISTTARANELILLSIIEACSSFIYIKTCLERPSVKYIVFFFYLWKIKIFLVEINSNT